MFRLWAPAAQQVALRLEDPGSLRERPMPTVAPGWFALEWDEVGAGTRYRFRVDGGSWVPDPASRFQPEGVHGPSELIDPAAFEWSDEGWRGRPWEETVIYELHVGAFTAAGDFQGVADRLDHLVELGVTAIELMPVAECPGRRNWGYDAVYPFAPESCYGRPAELKALVQAAHRRGLMVLLDVVYNHFGPEGNHLHRYAPAFFTDRHRTPWGAAIDFTQRPVRDFFIHNALYWLEEFHLDGLRLDAVHAIHDASHPDFLTELAQVVHERIPPGRHVHLVLENDGNQAKPLERDPEGRPRRYAAQWNDDAHHALHVMLAGERDGYYQDYADRPIRHLGRCLTQGFAYQGEPSAQRRGARRGEASTHLPLTAFVTFLQNHDQIGNRPLGDRIAELGSADAIRAATAILLLAPSPPLLFMGQEWGTRQPFPFFCDFEPWLARRVREGRRREFAGFVGFRDPRARERIPDPGADPTFRSAVLRWEELGGAIEREWWAFHQRLLALRHREIVPRLAGLPGHAGEFHEIGERALVGHWRLGDGSQLGLVAQLGDAPLTGAPAPPRGHLLFATPDSLPTRLARGEMPAWSVAWYLDDAAPGRA